MVSGRININAEDTSLFFLTIMSFLITSCRKLLLKRKQSFLDNKISFCTRYVVSGITDYETVEGSTYYYSYIVVGYSCDCKVFE